MMLAKGPSAAHWTIIRPKVLVVWALCIILTHVAAASTNLTFTYQGRAYQADGATPLTDTNVTFKLGIYSHDGNCLLYEEQFTGVNLSSTSGLFSLQVGGGAATSDTPVGQTMLAVFTNGSSIPVASSSQTACGATTYTPSVNQIRKLKVTFITGATTIVLSPMQEIVSTPYTMVAETLQGKDASKFIQVTGSLTQSDLESLMAQKTALLDLATGNSTTYMKAGSALTSTLNLGNQRITNVASPSAATDAVNKAYTDGRVGGMSVDSTIAALSNAGADNGKILQWDSTNQKWTAQAFTPSISAGSITNTMIASGIDAAKVTTGVVAIANGGTGAATTSAAAQVFAGPTGAAGAPGFRALVGADLPSVPYAKLPIGTSSSTVAAGDDTRIVGALQASGGTMSGDLNMGSNKITAVANVPFAAAAPGAGNDGQTLVWNNGSSAWVWVTPGIAGSGLTNLNGATGTTQSFAIGTSSTAPAFSTASNIHTLNIPMASTASVTAGLLSNADYTAFNGKLDSSTTFAGDVGGAYNTLSVDKIKGKAVTPTTYASGQTLRYDGNQWVNAQLSYSDLSGALPNASLPALTGDVTSSGNTVTLNTVSIAKGGTGETTASAALTALLPAQTPNGGKFLTTDGSTASWGDALSSLNGSSLATQTFATPGTAGTAPNWSTNTGTGAHTLNIPMASTASVTAGLLSNTDYSAFNNKFNASSGGTVTGNVTFSSGSVAFNGTTTFGAALNMGSHAINGVTDPTLAQDAATKNYTDTHIGGGTFSTALTSNAGKVLTVNGTEDGFILTTPATGAITGVTTGTAATTGLTGGGSSGTLSLAVNLGTGANQVVQLDGSGKLPTTIFPATLPAASAANLTSIPAANITGTLPAISGANLTSLVADNISSGTLNAARLPSSVLQNGVAAGAMTIGTSDANSLTLKTNDAASVTVLSGGNVGIGTTSPVATLMVNGTTPAAGTVLPYFGTNNLNATVNIDGAYTYTTLTGNSSNRELAALDQMMISPTSNATNTAIYGRSIQAIIPSTNTYSIPQTLAAQAVASNYGSGSVNKLSGISSYAANYGSGNVGSLWGGSFSVFNSVSGATVTNAYGVQSVASNSGTITNAYGVYVSGYGSAGTWTNTPYDIYAADANAYNYFAGNVGIGVSSPSSTLHIQHQISGDTDTPTQTWIHNYNAGAGTYGMQLNAVNYTTGTGGFNFATNWGKPISFGVNSGASLSTAQQLTITQGGNVGIGTTNPSSALDLKGTMTFEGSSSGSVTLRAPASGGAATLVLPSTNGTSGQVLSTDGSGNLSWASASSGGGSGGSSITDIDSSTYLMLHFDNSTADSSSFATSSTGTAGSITYSSSTAKFGGSAATFNGSSYIDFATNAYSPFTGDFTVDFWIYPTSFPANDVFFDTNVGSGSSFIVSAYASSAGANANKLYTYVCGGSYWSTNAIALNTWSHIAVVRSISTFKAYINGNLEITVNSCSTNLNSGNLRIGGQWNGGQPFHGQMDEFRLSKAARWTAPFTPFTQAYGSSSSSWNGTASSISYSAGNVGIGTTDPQYTLDVNGSARATGSVTAWSDIRAKKNIEPIENSLDKISKLNGVTFDWRTDEFPDKKFKTTRDMGVIAQEVETVFPEVVATAPDGYKSVAYPSLIAPVIEAIKELNRRIAEALRTSDDLSRDIASVKTENAELKARADKADARAEKAEKENEEIKARLKQIENILQSN